MGEGERANTSAESRAWIIFHPVALDCPDVKRSTAGKTTYRFYQGSTAHPDAWKGQSVCARVLACHGVWLRASRGSGVET